MMYADNCCTYTEKRDLGIHKYIFKGQCVMCTKEQTVEIRGEELYKYRQGANIENALSNNADEREFLISGICAKCWENTFSDKDEVDDKCPMCGGAGFVEPGNGTTIPCSCVEIADYPTPGKKHCYQCGKPTKFNFCDNTCETLYNQ